jgi:glycosyltransferase involved in cell wall biosynthesis
MLREAVASVLAQTYRPIEVLVVDDGSTDGTADECQALARAHPEVRVLTQANGGPGAARERGRKLARGEFIQYLDSDDLLEPTKFERQVAALSANPRAGVAYGETRRIDISTGESRTWAKTAGEIEQLFPGFLMQRGWDTNSPLWRRSADEAIGPWLPLCSMEDWEHDVRAGLLGVEPVRVAGVVAIVRDHGTTRASGMTSGFTVAMVRDMFVAHDAVWRRMRDMGRTEWSHVEPFARKMFWIARLCGERDLVVEADRALANAEQMIETHRSAWRIRAFRALTRIVGWQRAVTWGEKARSLLRRGTEAAHA